MPKVVAISSIHQTKKLVEESRQQGYITFIYHHADPKHLLLGDKFLYIHSDEELVEKLDLMKLDCSVQDIIRR